MSITSQLHSLDNRLKEFETRFAELGYDNKRLVATEFKKRWKFILEEKNKLKQRKGIT